MANNKYEVGYAKTAKSGCKDTKCLNPGGKNIDKGNFRIAKITDSPFGDDVMTQWYHPACIFNALKRAKADTKKITSTDDLEGFDDLEKSDQQICRDLIAGKKPAGSGAGGKPDKKNKARAPAKEAPAKKQKKEAAVPAAVAGNIHAGRVFAITGALSMVRKKVVDLIEERGGKFAPSVTNQVTHLIAANPWMMTNKMDEAKAKGIEIVGEDFIMSGNPPQVWQAADVKKKATAKWQFLDNGNVWGDYDAEANDIVEACYDDWLLNPFTPVRAVKSGTWMYTLNFASLEQTNVAHPAHTVRKVRRVQ